MACSFPARTLEPATLTLPATRTRRCLLHPGQPPPAVPRCCIKPACATSISSMARGVTRSQGSNYGSLVHPHFLLLLYPPLARASKTPIPMSPPILSISQRAIIDLHSSTRPSSRPLAGSFHMLALPRCRSPGLGSCQHLPPFVALFRGCSLYLLLFVQRLGRKNIKACSNTPSTFPSRLADAVTSVQAPIVESSPSRTSRATTPCVVRLPHHRCSVAAWPWRRPVMFRFRMHTLPPASASCEALRRETRDPKRVSWAVVTVDAALADNTTPRQPTGDLTMSSGRRGDGAGAGVQHVCFVVRSNVHSTWGAGLSVSRILDPSTMASTVEHGSGQQTRGPNPSLPTSMPRAVWTQKNSTECQGLLQVTESGFWPPPRLPPKPRLALTTDYRIHLDASRRRSNRFGLDNTTLNMSSPPDWLDELLPVCRVQQEMSQGGTIRRFRWC